jgi:hypothetical protein
MNPGQIMQMLQMQNSHQHGMRFPTPQQEPPKGPASGPNGPYKPGMPPQMHHGMQGMNPGQIMQMLQMQNSQQPQAGLGAISGAAPTGYNPGYM